MSDHVSSACISAWHITSTRSVLIIAVGLGLIIAVGIGNVIDTPCYSGDRSSCCSTDPEHRSSHSEKVLSLCGRGWSSGTRVVASVPSRGPCPHPGVLSGVPPQEGDRGSEQQLTSF